MCACVCKNKRRDDLLLKKHGLLLSIFGMSFFGGKCDTLFQDSLMNRKSKMTALFKIEIFFVTLHAFIVTFDQLYVLKVLISLKKSY